LLPDCPPLRATNLGGVGGNLNASAIAKRLAPKVIAHWYAGRDKVVVCIDRENRSVCAPGLAGEVRKCLSTELSGRNTEHRSVEIVVMDRTFEAWLLADARGHQARQDFIMAPNFHAFEGQAGDRQRKGVTELARLLGREYRKTIDGPRLFARLNFDAARRFGPNAHGSRSLHKFLRSLGL
jgi:hypothetical protein